jgi:hypothetical protein
MCGIYSSTGVIMFKPFTEAEEFNISAALLARIVALRQRQELKPSSSTEKDIEICLDLYSQFNREE